MLNFKSLRGVVFDMDGVIWRGDEPLPGVPSFFSFLRENQIQVAFATNNSSRTPQMYVNKLANFGIEAQNEQVITSALVTAHYLRTTYPTLKTVYLIGKEGLRQALQDQGFKLTEEQADLLVVGFDPTVTYMELRAAAYQIQGGAIFIGSNPDKNFPEPNGFAPGAGSILAAIETATGASPTIIGKPHPPMFQMALEVLGTEPSQTLMVGDRVETDICGAQALGMSTVLVLSGVSQREDIEQFEITPDGVFADLAELQQHWQNALGA